MPQSLANVLLHIVFGTKNRACYLRFPDVRESLKAYTVEPSETFTVGAWNLT